MIYQPLVPAKAGHIGDDPSRPKFHRNNASHSGRLTQFCYQNVTTTKVMSLKLSGLVF
jgi:hypothetical protein